MGATMVGRAPKLEKGSHGRKSIPNGAQLSLKQGRAASLAHAHSGCAQLRDSTGHMRASPNRLRRVWTCFGREFHQDACVTRQRWGKRDVYYQGGRRPKKIANKVEQL